MKTKKLYLDFEFRNPQNRYLDLLCVAWKDDSSSYVNRLWIEDKKDRELFAVKIAELAKDHVFIAYVVEAEARCLFQMWDEFNCHPEDVEFIDLYIEYRMLTNHNHELAYGEQLIKGKKVFTKPPRPKYQQIDNDDLHHKPEHSLTACCYKMLGEEIDAEHKDEMRNLIISGKPLNNEEVHNILMYCADDVKFLPQLFKEISQYLFKKLGSHKNSLQRLRREARLRGEYAARTARMVMLGYPINYDALKRFSGDTDQILRTEAEEINKQYPEIKPFIWNSKTQKYVQKTHILREWIEKQGHPDWLRTDKGALSLSLEAFRKYYSSQSKNLGGAMNKYLYTKQSLNGFLPQGVGSKRRSFWEFVGEDKRVRPYFGIYGAQSARSQPAATGFLPLKANWMRAFIMPPEGRAIAGIDYGSQEFLISALLSEDDDMIKAYESGDPYLYFAKLDGAVPWDGTKEGYADERNIYKTVTLGISYLMGPKSLAFKLSQELNKTYTEDDAQDLINRFYEAFPDFADWQTDHIENYYDAGCFAKVKLPCGWYMFSDNPNRKSVGNAPIQGFGSSIMRKAVQLAQDRDLSVIYTLHDAIYIEYDHTDWNSVGQLFDCMDEGFRHYFPKHLKHRATCRLDAFAWSKHYKKETIDLLRMDVPPRERILHMAKKVDTSDIYIDKKGEKDYLKYVKYFTK
jgi:hypothetical protein